MQSFSPIPEFLSRVPPFAKLVALIGIVSFVAIFVFNLAVGTVISYAIFALLCGSHLFMHGSNREHAVTAPIRGKNVEMYPLVTPKGKIMAVVPGAVIR